MRRPGPCFAGILVAGLLSSASAQAAPAAATSSNFFQKFCFECHGNSKPKAGLSLEQLIARPSVGPHAEAWEKVVEMLEMSEMPPSDATKLPTEVERAAAAAWVRATLKTYEREHGGEPGRVTVRRLTSGEYAYAVRDLTGLDLKSGIDVSSDSVGGEGFTNFGDVQFMQDAIVERYLEGAKKVADHAVVGAGPLQFYSDPGRSGLELSALNRINQIYEANGFRVVSGEGGRPFGLERYSKAFLVAWSFKHRVALGRPNATLRDLAAGEGIAGRFAEHVWSVVNRTALGYPSREMVDRWKTLPTPAGNAAAVLAQARAGCDDLTKVLTTWPSWFFGRGDVAAGGAGDESPLMFDDTALKVEASHRYVHVPGGRGGRGRGGPAATPGAPLKIFLVFANINPSPGVNPVVIWRNPRVVTRAVPTVAGRGAPGAVAPDATDAVVAGGVRGRGPSGPILFTQPLRALLPTEAVAALAFGRSPDGTVLGPEDFATTATVSFELTAAAAGTTLEFQVDAELGADRNAVVRVVVSERESGPPARGGLARVFLGDSTSEGYRTFRAGIAEYVSLLPPNSHGEANPADKDPVPPPFDNTFNSPEHDAFVLKVKYQRTDAFLTDNLVDGADRTRLNEAWNDLFGSWPYHDAYLGMLVEHYGLTLPSRRIGELDAGQIAALPAEVRPHLTALLAHRAAVTKALTAAQPGHVEEVLAFASRAWRRPLTSTEQTRLRDFYRQTRATKLDHDDAVRAVIARILVSPAFLYRVETVASGAEQPLNDWELASRLSFFLWSSIPDDELRRAAAAGELSRPARLGEQVRRMTADPKARRLATEFFGQWLGFYRFDEFRGVDAGRFPEFTEEVKGAMYDEAVSTFEYLVRHERPLRELLHADYTFLNQPLARFYGLKEAVNSKEALVRVENANAFNRGGVLRLGAVLTTTSAPLRTSPVKRGDWVLRRILGTPTPPPPGDAGTLPGDPQSFGGLTLRARLTEHKRNPSCANCHLKIDPLGFPLEGFDAVGRTRSVYQDGVAVDTTGEFADKSVINGAAGLLEHLQGKEAQVMKTLSKKMLGYALGRTILASDRALIDDLTAAGGNATFSDLAIKIVASRQFRNRQGQDEDTPGAP